MGMFVCEKCQKQWSDFGYFSCPECHPRWARFQGISMFAFHMVVIFGLAVPLAVAFLYWIILFAVRLFVWSIEWLFS